MQEPENGIEFNDGSPPPPDDPNDDEAADKVGPTTSDRIFLLPATDQVRELQTILRDRTTTHSEFVFYADRIIRLVIEEGLNYLPCKPCTITTPTGYEYDGLQFARGNCGVSVCRSGEVMEQALRQCCRSIRIGKVLIGEDQRMLYARLMADIAHRRVLLMYPLLTTGHTIVKAVSILLASNVKEENIFLLSVFSHPRAIKQIRKHYRRLTIITGEVSSTVPLFFTTKYFGTD
ncbi:hypothetical protein AAVH_04624 [Aphelenchoides avenae]|nr:hypothetical protein AAVH_04624 [Aphelenchus avenae]